jgi:hypothetical protein
LSLKTPEDFLVKLRQTFSVLLIERAMYNEAKTEIQKVIGTRDKHGWKLPNQIVQWTEQDWYKSASPNKDNRGLYINFIQLAEEALFQDVSEEIVVVEFVNENKSILNFVKDRNKFGFFNYSGKLEKPQIGDFLKVRFNGGKPGELYKILTAKKLNSDFQTEAHKIVEGPLKIVAPSNFGFVEDVFISSQLIDNVYVAQDDFVKVRAILSFNKKKKDWGWKAILISK